MAKMLTEWIAILVLCAVLIDCKDVHYDKVYSVGEAVNLGFNIGDTQQELILWTYAKDVASENQMDVTRLHGVTTPIEGKTAKLKIQNVQKEHQGVYTLHVIGGLSKTRIRLRVEEYKTDQNGVLIAVQGGRFKDNQPDVIIGQKKISIRFAVHGAKKVIIMYCVRDRPETCKNTTTTKSNTLSSPLLIDKVYLNETRFSFTFFIVVGNAQTQMLGMAVLELANSLNTNQIVLYLVAAVLCLAILGTTYWYCTRKKRRVSSSEHLVEKPPLDELHPSKEKQFDDDNFDRLTIYEKLDECDTYEEPPTPKLKKAEASPAFRVPAPPPMRTTSDQVENDYLDPDYAMRKQAMLVLMRHPPNVASDVSRTSDGYLTARSQAGNLIADQNKVQGKLNDRDEWKNSKDQQNRSKQYIALLGGGKMAENESANHQYLTVCDDACKDKMKNDKSHYLSLCGDLPVEQKIEDTTDVGIYDNDQHQYLSVFGDVSAPEDAEENWYSEPIEEGLKKLKMTPDSYLHTCNDADGDDYLIPVSTADRQGSRMIQNKEDDSEYIEPDNQMYSGLTIERNEAEYTSLNTRF